MNSWIQMGINSNGEEVEVNDTDESNQEINQINYKQHFLQLKKKLKLLLFVSDIYSLITEQNLSMLTGKWILSRESQTEPEAAVESI